MFFLPRLRKVVRQVVEVRSRRWNHAKRRRSMVECLEPRLVLTASYVPAYVLEAPLEGVVSDSILPYNFPTFGDLDADGDLDLLIGQVGELTYFQNIGNSTTPVFAEQTGISDPFAGVTATIGVNSLPDPTLADWDADGDLDLALGVGASILAFENTGTAMMPDFVSLTGPDNPFDGVGVVPAITQSIAFGDLDGDDDLDAVLSSGFDLSTYSFTFRLNYLENQDGAFVPVPGNDVSNPIGQIGVGHYASPEVADLDGDADLDLVVTAFGSTLQFYENTGTATAANFVRPLGFLNFINQLDPTASNYAPAFGDLDDDGDQDLLVATMGSTNGLFQYFRAAGGLLNAPVNGVPSNLSMVEDTAFVFGITQNFLSVSDTNAGDNPLEITLETSQGTLTLGTTSGLTFSAGDEDGTDRAFTFRGTLSDINAALTGLTFVPDLNFSGQARITITTNDLVQSDGGEALFDVDTATIRVLSVQEAIADLIFNINQAVSFGDFKSGQGAALLRTLDLTGNLRTDVRNLKTYLAIVAGMTRSWKNPPYSAFFIEYGENILTGLLTD